MQILMIIIGLTTLFSLSYGEQEIKEDPLGDDKTEKTANKLNKRGLEMKDYCRYNDGYGWHVRDCSFPQDDGLGSVKQQDLELIKENSIEKGMENRLKDSRLKNPLQKVLEDGLESVEEKQEENE